MNSIFQNAMQEATRLTRAGKLHEARALLRRLTGDKGGVDVAPEFPKSLVPTTENSMLGKFGALTVRLGAAPGPSRAAPAASQEAQVPGGKFQSAQRRGAQVLGAQLRSARVLGAQFPGAQVPVEQFQSAQVLGAQLRSAQFQNAQLRGAQFQDGQSQGAPVSGGQFLGGHFSASAGQRDYKLYVPSKYHGQAVPLIVMLHGCTQSPDDFAAGTQMNRAAEAATCLVVYPAQPASANMQKCWNWFRAADQQRDGGEAALIAGLTRQVMRDYAVDPARVYIAGLSAGGAAAAIMGRTYPDLYAAVGVHSGLACGAARDMNSAFVAMQQGKSGSAGSKGAVVPTIVFHGDRDKTVHPRNGDAVAAQVMHVGDYTVRSEPVPGQGGRAATRTVYADRWGREVVEHFVVHGAGHAWYGGSPEGSYTDPGGPDATAEMMRFFLANPRR